MVVVMAPRRCACGSLTHQRLHLAGSPFESFFRCVPEKAAASMVPHRSHPPVEADGGAAAAAALAGGGGALALLSCARCSSCASASASAGDFFLRGIAVARTCKRCHL